MNAGTWLATAAGWACAAAALGADGRARVEATRIDAALRGLPTGRSAAGSAAEQEGLLQAQWWLKGYLAGMGLKVEARPVHVPRRLRGDEGAGPAPAWENILVELRGREHPQEVLIVGAHFDCVPGTAGADDNGSGVAALLEIARLLKDEPLKRTVRLIFFNLEEVGLVGSTQYAVELAERRAGEGAGGDAPEERLIGMISLEMLGFYRDEEGSQRSPFQGLKGLELPTKGDFVALAGVLGARGFIRQLDEQMRRAEPTCKTFVFDYSPIAPPDILRSDHAPFLLRSWPAVMVTDTADFRNPNYHEATDRVETIDLARLTRTASALAGAIGAMAGRVGEADAPAAEVAGIPDITQFMAPAGAGGGDPQGERPAAPK